MRVNQIDGNTIRSEFDSVEELASYAARFTSDRYPYTGEETELAYTGSGTNFYGDSCKTPKDVGVMARTGWEVHLQDTLNIAREAVETVEADVEVDAFNPVWDVSGSIVDVGQYLAGEPECMIEIPPAKTTRFGRIVTLCASVSYSSAINEKTLVARGKVVTALALELSRMGIGVEMYADFHTQGYSGKDGMFRTLVKGANDVLDPAKVLFAYANPCMLRVLNLTAMHGMPENFQNGLGVGMGYGCPASPEHSLPEGTIYLPELLSNRNVPNAAAELKRYMTELGLVNP